MYLFLERGEGSERYGEKHQCEKETLVGSRTSPNLEPDLEPNLQHSTLIRIQVATFCFGRAMPNQLNHTDH